MILDLEKFIREHSPRWKELEVLLSSLEKNPEKQWDLDKVRRFHKLYQHASSDLAQIQTFSAEKNIRIYLESLVAQSYAEIYETRAKQKRPSILVWFFFTFPQTFRRHFRAFALALALTFLGSLFGGVALLVDPEAKQTIMPWSHVMMDPGERVEKEESRVSMERFDQHKTSFSGQLMTHNTRVSIFLMALGMTFGLGTAILLFYNGVILGAVAADYMAAGQTEFLIGWLLPHGSVEIPAILLAGQAGFVLAGAIIGWGEPISFADRLRAVSRDLVTLIMGVALLLVWAGVVESFFSQYHEPIMPYSFKIAVGVVELVILFLFLARGGKTKREKNRGARNSAGPDLS